MKLAMNGGYIVSGYAVTIVMRALVVIAILGVMAYAGANCLALHTGDNAIQPGGWAQPPTSTPIPIPQSNGGAP
jgi:hypothetical protein